KANSIIHIHNNTILNGGVSGGGSASGGWYITSSVSDWTPDIHNNITVQKNGMPYIASGSASQSRNAAEWSKNLWFRNGAAPSFDTTPITGDPLLVSTSGTIDLHLGAGSSAINAGNVITSPSRDFDGVARPTSGSWDIGAYQSAGGSGSSVTVP